MKKIEKTAKNSLGPAGEHHHTSNFLPLASLVDEYISKLKIIFVLTKLKRFFSPTHLQLMTNQ